MKILKYKKISRGRYKITLDTNEIILYEDIIIKNNLLLQKDIDLELLEKVLNENKKYEAYDICLSYIEIKLRTEKEIRNYLENKNYDSNLIEETINRLKKDNLLNENTYIESYVNDKINLTTWGPYKIKRTLIDLGIDEYKIDDYLNTIDDNIFKEKLEKIISKRIKLMKNKSLYIIKNKLNMDLYNLGYDKEMISNSLNNLTIDDSESIKKEIEIAYNKYSKKYQGKELEYKIKNHLYKKGYKSNDYDLYEN